MNSTNRINEKIRERLKELGSVTVLEAFEYCLEIGVPYAVCNAYNLDNLYIKISSDGIGQVDVYYESWSQINLNDFKDSVSDLAEKYGDSNE